MVFGYLLGGILKEAGEQMHNEKTRLHADELEKHKMLFDMAYQRLSTQGADMTPEQINNLMKVMDDAYPKEKGKFSALAAIGPHLLQNIPHRTPSERVNAPTGGGVETSGQAPPESIMSPNQVPAGLPPSNQDQGPMLPSTESSETQPYSMPPMPERPAGNLNPQMTESIPPMPQMPTSISGMSFNEYKRARDAASIDESDLSPAAKEMAKAHLFGANISAYESALVRSSGQGYTPKVLGVQPIWIERDGQAFPVLSTTHGLRISDAQGNLIPYVSQPNDKHVPNTPDKENWQKVQDKDGNWIFTKPPSTPRGLPTSVGTGIQGKPTGGAGELTPEALDMEARKYAQTGQITGWGMGAAGIKASISNKTAELYKGTSLASSQANFKSLTADRTKTISNRDMVVAWEGTALDNLKLLFETAEALPYDTNSPILNTPIREAEKRFFGSEEVAAFQTARRVATNEIAKAITNPGLTGQPTSDAARKEADDLIAGNYSLNQIYASGRVLEKDMRNRHDRLDDIIDTIDTRIKNIATPEAKTLKQETSEKRAKESQGGGQEKDTSAPGAMPKLPVTISWTAGGVYKTKNITAKEQWDKAVSSKVPFEVLR